MLVVTPANEPIKDDHTNISDKPSVYVISKADLCSEKKISYIKKQFPSACIVSAKTSYGIPELLKNIQKHLGISSSFSPLVPVVTGRQNAILKKTAHYVRASIDLLSIKEGVPFELVSFELRDALRQIDIVLGKTTTDDILDSVFNSFCVGK